MYKLLRSSRVVGKRAAEDGASFTKKAYYSELFEIWLLHYKKLVLVIQECEAWEPKDMSKNLNR